MAVGRILNYQTANEHGYSVKVSPFFENRLVYVTCANFGITGRGFLHHLEIRPNHNGSDSLITRLNYHEWPDGLFDVSWNETAPDICVTASGDGTLQLWQLGDTHHDPLIVMKEHAKEVYSVEWCLIRGDDRLVSASWDRTIKIWTPMRRDSIFTMEGHESDVYCATWSPHIVDCIASCAGDGSLRIWSLKCPNSERVQIAAHESEILSCDWNKYDQNILATAATDGLVRIWDLRNLSKAIAQLTGHKYAVRRVKFSPHNESSLASVSYDFTTRFWDYKGFPQELSVLHNHTEFVYGLDFNIHNPKQVIDCGFDQLLCLIDFNN